MQIWEGNAWKLAVNIKKYEHFIMPFGLCNTPASFHEFGNTILDSILQTYQYQCLPSSACQPQTNGQTEQTNQTLETFHLCFVSDSQREYSSTLPWTKFSYNNCPFSSTGVSNFFRVLMTLIPNPALYWTFPQIFLMPAILFRLSNLK